MGTAAATRFDAPPRQLPIPWGAMKPRIVTDLVYFDEDAARTEVLHETEHLFSQVICLQEAQGIGPMRDAASEGLVVVLSGEVAAQVGATARGCGSGRRSRCLRATN